jgi:PAS domain S-box-containing protein
VDTEGKESVNRTADSSRNRPPMIVVTAGKNRPSRLIRTLREAGYRVEIHSPAFLRRQGARKPDRGKSASPKPAAAASLPPAEYQRNLADQSAAVLKILKSCTGLSAGVQMAALALFDPAHSACIHVRSVGLRSRGIPAHLPWKEFPILRLAFEQHKAVYVTDTALLPEFAWFGEPEGGGCLAIPLQSPQPAGVLLLSHIHAGPLDARGLSALGSLAQALETILENVVLHNRMNISETRYRSIVTAAPFLIALMDSNGVILEVNPKSLRELRRQGFSSRKVIGLNLLQTPVVPEELRRLLEECLEKGEAVSREKISVVLPRGTEVFRVHALPLHGRSFPGGELLIIGEMITSYHQLMDEAETTERLAAIGRVAASLAHEINNPLQALRSHLELIRSYPLSDEEREQSFRILEREVERLDETTRRVLGFARPAPDILQPVSITGVLEQALALSQNYLHNQQVEILTDMSQSLPPVLAAPGQLIQVFLNIILNAAHAMQGKGRLEVRTRSLGGRVEIVFTNNGPPIAAEYLARIFDPFFTTRPEGTGLGLSISHAILQRHNGTIQAANLPHRRGVAFTITLPFTAPAGATGKNHG